MQINLSQLLPQPQITPEMAVQVLKAFGLNGTGFENLSLMDTFGSPGNSALGTASLRDVEQMRGWNFTAILAKALQFGLGNMAVFCPRWIAEAIADANGEEYKASKRVNGTEQYGVPEDWVTAPRQHRIATIFREPNPWTDESTLLFQIAEQTDVHGVAHVLVLPDRSGLPKELWVIPKSAIRPMAPSAKFPEGSYRVGHLSKLSINQYATEEPKSIQQALARISNREFSSKYVISVGLPSPVFLDDFLNPSSAISDVIDTDRQIHVSRRNMLEQILSNGPRMEPLPGVTIANEEWNKIIDEFVANNTGPSRNGQPWRAPAGVKVVNDGQTGRELELAKSADQSRDHTLGQRLMNASMLGLGDGGSYAQVIGLIKGNARLVLQPLMRLYSGQLTLGLRRFFDAPQDQFMSILQAASIDDPEQRRAEIQLLIDAGAIKKGEVRDSFNLMPFGDDKDEEIAGGDASGGGMPGMDFGSDPYAQDYGTDEASDSGAPETPGVGMPETENLTMSGMVKTTEEQPQIGRLSRREFLRHQKNIFDILKQVSAGQIKPKAAILLLTTLGESREKAEEYVATVLETEQQNDTPKIVTAATATESGVSDMGQDTASALFSRAMQLHGFTKSIIDDQAKTAATNPDNGFKMPSEKELKAGTYRKGKIRVCGLQIEIENPQGSVRSGKRPDGSRWAVEMCDHYGYIVGALGYDKDQLDVFVQTGTEPDWTGEIFVINQANEDGTFDEHKCMVGYATKAEAIVRFLDNYSDNWCDRIMSVATLSVPEFKAWVFDPQGGPILGELTQDEAMRYKVVSQTPMIVGDAAEETLEEMFETDSEDFHTEELVEADPMFFNPKSGFFRAADIRDGDGDGVIFDGTPNQKHAYPEKLDISESEQVIAAIRAGDHRSKNRGNSRTEHIKTPHKKISVQLSEIPSDVVDLLESSTDPARVNQYATQDIKTPVVLFKRRKTKDWGVSDGGHRILAAMQRGDSKIDAYVPDDEMLSSKSIRENTHAFFRAADIRDGDGDGVIYDGTPQERPATRKEQQQKQSQDDTQRVMFEAAPDPNDITLTSRWRNLSDADRLAISRKLVQAIMPDVAEKIGVELAVSEQLGGYLDDTNPSFAAEFPRDITPDKFIRTMKAAGFALSQDSMMGISTNKIDGADEVGFVTVNMEPGQNVHDLYMKIRGVDSSVQGHTTIGNQMLIVDFTGRSEQIAQSIQDEFDVQTSHSKGYAVFVSKDQYGYGQESKDTSGNASAGGSSGLAEKRWGNDLRRKASEIINRELARVESGFGKGIRWNRSGLHSGFFRAVGDTEYRSEPRGISQEALKGAAEQYDEFDTQKRAELIAEILTGIYGDRALQLVSDGEDFVKMATVFKSFTDAAFTKAPRQRRQPQPGADPRDADGDGRIFDGTPQERAAGIRQPQQPQPRRGRVRNTPEQVQAIHADISNALKGERTAKSAKALADKLSTLTVKQLTDLKRQYGIAASGRVKKELVDKIAKRLDVGRRTPVEPKQPQVQTPKHQTPAQKKPENKKTPLQQFVEKKPEQKQEQKQSSESTSLKVIGTVSDQFKSTVTTALEKLPEETKALMKLANVDVRIGDRLTNILPHLKGQKPRGWPDGTTWDNVDGVAFGRVAAVSELSVSHKTGEDKTIKNPTKVLYHEIGHGIDNRFRISSSQEFASAYEEDLKSFSKYDKFMFSYLLQPGSAGRQETVAEAFALMHGATQGHVNDDELFKKRFSRSIAVISSQMKKARGQS